jgi:NAD-dependent dihydropyrimidine dehydrogenase PreA subunit
MEDIDELEALSHFIKENSLCGLGQTSPNPVLSTLRYFRNEYEDLVKNAGKPKTPKYRINKEKCIGCSACSRACPVKCINGEIKKPFEIDEEKCIGCGTCQRTCKFNAIEKV